MHRLIWNENDQSGLQKVKVNLGNASNNSSTESKDKTT